MANDRVFAMSFASVYPHYVTKAEKKGRTKEEVDEIIRWLTGYSKAGLEKQIRQKTDFRTFFDQAPKMNPNASLIKGNEPADNGCAARCEAVALPRRPARIIELGLRPETPNKA